MGVTVTSDVKVLPGKQSGSGGPGPGDPRGPEGPNGSKEWPPGFSREDAIEPHKYRIGMWVGLAGIMMLFVSLTSALILRRTIGLSDDAQTWWTDLRMPPILWVNTALLLVSSFSIEAARRSLRRNDYNRFNRWITTTTVLGVVFLIGQIMAWRQLAAQGIYINSNPHSSFFYLLTCLHGVHLLGGVIALFYITVAALRFRISVKKRIAVNITALYWHFMDGLWVYLLVLLFFVS